MDFLGIGSTEFLVIALVAFLFLGPRRMAGVARSLGRIVQEIRHTASDLPSLMALDEPLDQPPKSQPKNTKQEPESDTQEKESSEG